MTKHLRTTLTLAVVVFAAFAATAVAGNGKGGGHGMLYQFRGELVSSSTSSVTITVEGGNHAALKAMLGQTQNQTFTVGDTTEVLLWSKGIPTVGHVSDLKSGDWVVVNVRAKPNSSLGDVEANAAGIVADHASAPTGKAKPLFLFRGTVDGAQSGGHVALHVKGGNRLALRLLIGQSSDQTFSYDANTIFLLWQGKVPTVIDASQLKAGDRITVRIRAAHDSTLSQVEATPAKHVGDHEPANAPDKA
ncbi:MAG TPA: hypothetical protein VI408_09215 [Gaiellaceae bacterium]